MAVPRSASSAPVSCFGHDLGIHGIAVRTKNLIVDNGKFVPLGPHLRQPLGQLFFEFVQFRTPRGDPFQQIGIHALDRRRPPGLSEREPQSCPLLLGGLPQVPHPR